MNVFLYFMFTYNLIYYYLLKVQFAMFAGLRALGWSVSSLEAISAARGAASGVYGIIDAVSIIEFTVVHAFKFCNYSR